MNHPQEAPRNDGTDFIPAVTEAALVIVMCIILGQAYALLTGNELNYPIVFVAALVVHFLRK